ncbi:hypothetical protein [Actinoplanes derwentensis]|uniref:Uncharacterized protein n=1 Tax=Actinoplanes derwentensis TaxID=113562 RepID=A0A1H2AGP6_9ACTN|nr:hypothetical protein [Actinoplanes derwentensis]GID88266.1 hypothetical protein Ade03nite_71900 [Actinoplanes derwentensis]SDT44989.1 hypothetical protein SAMN04489716_3847 [Actinoplanes derwentensis]
MTAFRYALRSASFATAYLVVYLTCTVLPWFPVPALAVAAVWLTAQTGYGNRRLDVVMLATVAMVGATLNGAGLLLCAVAAIVAVLPALLFAVLMQRQLPGFWQGHGDRFRKPRAALVRLAGIAPLAAATGIVLETVADTGFAAAPAALHFAIGTATLFLAPLAVRATRTHSDGPGRPTLTVVR